MRNFHPLVQTFQTLFYNSLNLNITTRKQSLL